ncbi:MAG: GAF domain-containing protein [Hyphomicrobiales bacterium]|nr:MAG: GAF domain-containing protein [Hyphomicrobiales bacterium]
MVNFTGFLETAESGGSHDIFAALDSLIQHEVGALICSCSTFDPATQQAKRIYSNQLEAYPLSGLKQIVPNRWTDIVLMQGKVFIANTLAEIAEVFPDPELIHSLGCGSVMNMPLQLAGRFLGTINILHEPGYFTPERQKMFERLKPAGIIAFCSHS